MSGVVGSSKTFYQQIKPFKRFSEVALSRHYHAVPSDWWIVITDIKGSTEALLGNRYKDINLLGASSIIAVMNVLEGQEVPFVFGGDGATLLVHSDDIEKVKPALRGTRRLAKDVLNFQLRVGLVPVSFLAKNGYRVELAKFEISPKVSIAALRGGGLTYAESLVKGTTVDTAEFRLELDKEGDVDVSNFTGLSCRWNPIQAKRGEMMSLLIMALRSESAEQTYQRIIKKIESILNEDESRPVTPERLDRRINLKTLFKEMQTKTMGQSFVQKAKYFAGVVFEELVMHSFLRFGWKYGNFNAREYVREMGENTDFQKFDDMIRMVRDCSPAQRDGLVAMLKEERAKGEIAYGVHLSQEALLTCLVFQLDNHIHFVDGNGGGYAMASRQLKDQLKESAANKQS